MELFDEELLQDSYKNFQIKTLKPFKIDKDIKKALKKMSDINQEILDKKNGRMWNYNCKITIRTWQNII